MSEPIDRVLDAIPWTALPAPAEPSNGWPVATHEGWLRIGAVRVHVYQLSDGQRVVDDESLARLFPAGDE